MSISMKRTFFGFIVLAILLIFAGCGASGTKSGGAALSPDFFDGKIEGQITISAYNSMTYKTYLEEAARGFEALYPGTKVNIETFSAMPVVTYGGEGDVEFVMMVSNDDPQSRQDYLNRINTNLMSGTGADIYAMDIPPLHKYVESKMLENLEPYMNLDPGFNKADYRQNIFEALRYKDGVWFMPMDYSFNYFVYDSTLVPANIAAGLGMDKAFSFEDLLKLGIPLYNGSHQIFEMDWTYISSRLLNENMQTFINLDTKRANFVDGRFTGLLNSVRDYAQQGYIPDYSSQRGRDDYMWDTMAAPSPRYYFKQESNYSLINPFINQFPPAMRIMGFVDTSAITDDNKIAGLQANAGGQVPFTYWQGFGMNSQSKNKAAAWAFIKYLLSYEVQSTNLWGIGFPINNEARAEKAEFSLFGGTLEDAPGTAGITVSDQQLQTFKELLEEYRALVEKLSDNINTYVLFDASLNDMVSPEVQHFYDGTRTADEVARVLQNRIDLYLSE